MNVYHDIYVQTQISPRFYIRFDFNQALKM